MCVLKITEDEKRSSGFYNRFETKNNLSLLREDSV